MKQAAILLVNAELLADILQLPQGSKIEAIAQDIERPDVFKIRIVGAGWPVEEGDCIPCTAATCTAWVPSNGLNWNFPD